MRHGPENTDIIFLKFCGFCVPDSSPFPSSIPHAFQINFNSLYTALCEQQTSDQATLLLYTLLHQNSNVRTYMLARTDMENLVSITLHISCFLYCLIFWRAVSFPRRVSMFAWLQRWGWEMDGELPPGTGVRRTQRTWQCCHRAGEHSSMTSFPVLQDFLSPWSSLIKSFKKRGLLFSGYSCRRGSFQMLSVHPPRSYS